MTTKQLKEKRGEIQVKGNIHNAFASIRMKALHEYFLNYQEQPRGTKRNQKRAVARWLDKQLVQIQYLGEHKENFRVISEGKPLVIDVQAEPKNKMQTIKYIMTFS